MVPLDVQLAEIMTSTPERAVYLLGPSLWDHDVHALHDALQPWGGLRTFGESSVFGRTTLRHLIELSDPTCQANVETWVHAILDHGAVPTADLVGAAAQKSLDSVVDRLLSMGMPAFDVDTARREESTPLHMAAGTSLAIVERLIAAGAPLNEVDAQGYTPLHTAIWAGQAEVVSALLDAGALHSVRSSDGSSLLHAAVEADPLITQTLLIHGADVGLLDDRGRTALHRLVIMPASTINTYKDRCRRAEHLLLAGANPNALDQQGQTPLSLLVHSHRNVFEWRMLRALITHGADLGTVLPGQQRSPGEVLYDRYVTNPYTKNTVEARRLNVAMELFLLHRDARQVAIETPPAVAPRRRRL